MSDEQDKVVWLGNRRLIKQSDQWWDDLAEVCDEEAKHELTGHDPNLGFPGVKR